MYIDTSAIKPGFAVRGLHHYFHAWHQHNETFDSLSVISSWVGNLAQGDRVERVSVRFVSRDYFNVLSLHPVLGRTFTQEEDMEGGPSAMLLSYALWERSFGKDPESSRRTVSLDGERASQWLVSCHPKAPSRRQGRVATNACDAGKRAGR